MQTKDRIQFLYLHHWVWYHSNRIDVDEYCKRLRKLDSLFNKDSRYYKLYHTKK